MDSKQQTAPSVNEEESTLAEDPSQAGAGRKKGKRGMDQQTQRRLDRQNEELKKELTLTNTADTIQHFSKGLKRDTSVNDQFQRPADRFSANFPQSKTSINPLHR
jgi:hypothetical protein